MLPIVWNWHQEAFISLSRWVSLKGPLCLYCGQIAETKDHFPPRSVAYGGFLLPACRECNCGLCNNHPFDLAARMRLAKERIRRRHRKALAFPLWTVEQIESLGPNLKREVNRWQERRRIVHARLAWNADEYLANIDLHKDFVAIAAKQSTIRKSAAQPLTPIEISELRQTKITEVIAALGPPRPKEEMPWLRDTGAWLITNKTLKYLPGMDDVDRESKLRRRAFRRYFPQLFKICPEIAA